METKQFQTALPEQALQCAQVRALIEERGGLRAYVHTYGCQQNVSDSERLQGLLLEMGYSLAGAPEDADLILYNTCAIREHAENRVFGNVGALKAIKARRPGMKIGLCGCMLQQEHAVQRILEKYPFVDLIFGTHVLHRLPEFLYRLLTGEKRVVETGTEDTAIHEGLPVHRDGRIKAWLPVMYGCDNFCTYCVVPYVRGRERSRAPEAVEREARALVQAGYREITLLGQNVNSYGKGFSEPCGFPALLRRLDALEGEFWLRFMTSHPKDATRELIDTMAAGRHIARQLHLPVQSGSDRVLAAMNRRYTAERYLSLVRYAREAMPSLTLSTDIIVGFPGETEEEFRETLALVKEAQYDSMFAFLYSPRPGTPAEKMENQVPHEVKTRRFAELMQLQEEIAKAKNRRLQGQRLRVLPDGVQPHQPGFLTARTEGNIFVNLAASPDRIGRFTEVEITSAHAWMLKAKPVEPGA